MECVIRCREGLTVSLVNRDRDATLMGALCSLLEIWMAAWPEEDNGEGRGKVFDHSMHS